MKKIQTINARRITHSAFAEAKSNALFAHNDTLALLRDVAATVDAINHRCEGLLMNEETFVGCHNVNGLYCPTQATNEANEVEFYLLRALRALQDVQSALA